MTTVYRVVQELSHQVYYFCCVEFLCILLFSQIFSVCLRLLGASPLDPHWASAPGPRWGDSTSVPHTHSFVPPPPPPPEQIRGYAPEY